MAGHGLVIDVLPGTRPLPHAPEPGMTLEPARLAEAGIDGTKLASLQAHARAHHGDLRPVIDAGSVHPMISCVAAPLRLSRHDVGAVWLMLPGGTGVPAPLVAATRRAAGRIASELSRPPFPTVERTPRPSARFPPSTTSLVEANWNATNGKKERMWSSDVPRAFPPILGQSTLGFRLLHVES